MSRVTGLFRLQSIDLELDRITERLEEIQHALADEAEVQRSHVSLQHATDQYDELHSRTTAADHEVLAQRDKIRRTDTSLYSGTIKNPKELEDLQLESESLKRHLVTLEDRLLDAMVELEAVEVEMLTAAKALQTATADQEVLHARLLHEQMKLNQKEQTLHQEREAVMLGITEADLKIYQELRQRFAGLAIATLVEDSCNSCGFGIPPSIRQTVRSGSELVRCSQCSRILYPG